MVVVAVDRLGRSLSSVIRTIETGDYCLAFQEV